MGQGNRTGVIGEGGHRMGLVKTRRLAAMRKQQRAKAGMKPPVKKGAWALPPHLHKSCGKLAVDLLRKEGKNGAKEM